MLSCYHVGKVKSRIVLCMFADITRHVLIVGLVKCVCNFVRNTANHSFNSFAVYFLSICCVVGLLMSAAF